MTDQLWIGDSGPYDVEIVEEEHENWNDNSTSKWIRYGKRILETGTAVFHVYCCQQHAEDGGDCFSFLGIDAPWKHKHNAELLVSVAGGLERTEKIGVVASYREIVLRQRNHSRDEVKR